MGENNTSIPREIERWEKVREGGKLRYILLYGVLYWGVPMFVTMTFLVNRASKPEPATMAFLALVWAAGGAFFGWVMWKVMEGRYLKFLAERERGEED